MMTCWCSCGCDREVEPEWDVWMQDWEDTVCLPCLGGLCRIDDDE